MLQVLSKSARKVRMHFKEFFKSYIDIEKLIEVFDIIPKYEENPDHPHFEFKQGNIEFKNLNF
jgi:ABC-type transport system involved in Fe-S cluster assembly fused permease/ATPase subunit